MNKTYYGDVEQRVEFARGYINAVNAMEKTGVYLSADAAERHIRKTHAKAYGIDSKYDGKGNKRELPYA